MSDEFTPERFLPQVGQLFRVLVNEKEELRTVLTEVALLAPHVPTGRTPFSLIFHAQHDAFIPQAVYPIANYATGTFECFLVPIGPDEVGMRFEAIFT
jgi:hypothetical protein